MRAVGTLPVGCIAAQRNDVTDPFVPVVAGDLIDLVARGLHAGEMRGGGYVRLVLDPHDLLVRALTGRATSAIGHACKPRPQRRKCFHAAPQRFAHLFVLGREELEAHLDVTGQA